MAETENRPPVRVVQAHANHGVVHVDGQARKIHFPRRLARPLAGDWVHIDSQGTLEKTVARTNSFGRGDGRGRFRAIAANIDRALIVIAPEPAPSADLLRSEEHTSELQSRGHLVCRLLLEKKKTRNSTS